MSDRKDYKVISDVFVTANGDVAKKGDVVNEMPRHGNTLCGLRFKQIRPAGKKASPADEGETTANAKAGA